jgi:hypothetical protein
MLRFPNKKGGLGFRVRKEPEEGRKKRKKVGKESFGFLVSKVKKDADFLLTKLLLKKIKPCCVSLYYS